MWCSRPPQARPRSRQRTRWLADAEADHGGADTPAESSWRTEPGAGAAVAKGVDARRTASRAVAPNAAKTVFGRVAAGHAPQTELAESEAVSADRTRPPPTAGHRACTSSQHRRPARLPRGSLEPRRQLPNALHELIAARGPRSRRRASPRARRASPASRRSCAARTSGRRSARRCAGAEPALGHLLGRGVQGDAGLIARRRARQVRRDVGRRVGASGSSRGAKRVPAGDRRSRRSRRKVRQSSRSQSHATRYQRRPRLTRLCGSTQRAALGRRRAPR